jgi:hypothetical protein
VVTRRNIGEYQIETVFKKKSDQETQLFMVKQVFFFRVIPHDTSNTGMRAYKVSKVE